MTTIQGLWLASLSTRRARMRLVIGTLVVLASATVAVLVRRQPSSRSLPSSPSGEIVLAVSGQWMYQLSEEVGVEDLRSVDHVVRVRIASNGAFEYEWAETVSGVAVQHSIGGRWATGDSDRSGYLHWVMELDGHPRESAAETERLQIKYYATSDSWWIPRLDIERRTLEPGVFWRVVGLGD